MRISLILSLVVLLTGCITINTAPQPNKITLEEFNQLKEGMSYNEIQEILGVEGTFNREWDDYGNAVVSFKDQYGGTVLVNFRDAKAYMLYPSGLE